MLHITAKLYAKAVTCDYQTASRRLRKLPYTKGTNGTRFYTLARAIPTLRHLDGLPALISVAKSIEGTLPDDAEAVVDTFEAWLAPHKRNIALDAARARLEQARRAFVQHLSDAMQTTRLLRHSEYLRKVILLDDAVLRWTMTGNQHALPNQFNKWAIEFALTNTNQKEKIAA